MTIDAAIAEQARSSDADVRQRAALSVAQSESGDAVPILLDLLGDTDWRVRKTVVEGFVARPSTEIIQRLIESLRDPVNAGKRNSATEALTRIGARAIPIIVGQLEQERDVDVRLSLVNLLGDLRSDEGYEALTGLFETEEDLNILSSSVASVGKFRQARSIPLLVKLLQRDDLWLKFHVIEALGEIGDRSALPAILPLYAEKSLRKPVLEAIGRIGDVGTANFLLKVIADEERLNLTALRALVEIVEADKPKIVKANERQVLQRKFRELFPASKIVPLIEHLRSSTRKEVRTFLLKFLGWSSDPRALQPLLEFLENPDHAETAAQALIDFGGGAVDAVLTRLQNVDEDETVALLLRVLNILGDQRAVGSIINHLDHENALIRRLAIETLGGIPDPSTIDYLLTRLDDPDVACQQAAVNAISALVAAFPETKQETLVRIRRLLDSNSTPVKLNSLSIFVNIQGQGHHDELLLASKDEDAAIRQKAITLMGRFGDSRFADQIVLALADESTVVRIAAIESIVQIRPESGLRPLINAMEDEDPWIRAAAAQALCEYRSEEAVDSLLRHIENDLTPVRVASIEALGNTGGARAKQVLLDSLDDADSEIRRAALLALAHLPDSDVRERLRAELESRDWRVRAAAAQALGNANDRHSLPRLHALLSSDPDPYVRHAAVAALDRIGDRSSFEHLLAALENREILDDVSDLFVRHRDTYRGLLEAAWRTADSRREAVIAAILQEMKEQP